MTNGPVLLDTHIFIWLQEGLLRQPTAAMVLTAALRGELFVSAVSAWEIGLLHRKAARQGTMSAFSPDPRTWFARAMSAPGLKEAPFTPDIAIDSSLLPEPLHGDPGDRLLVATARHLGASLATRDRNILDYAALGHVRAVPC